MICGDFLDKSEKDLNTFSDCFLDFTDDFRAKCLQEGYRLTKIYPIYYQGWEMDEWGAIGVKDNKTYNLTTSHGTLIAKEIESDPIVKTIRTLVFD